MKLKRPAAMLCAMAIAAVGVTAAAAGQGSQEDPLLTLSYLDKVLKPQLEAQVDQAVQANEAALAQRLEEAAKGYAQQTRAAPWPSRPGSWPRGSASPPARAGNCW